SAPAAAAEVPVEKAPEKAPDTAPIEAPTREAAPEAIVDAEPFETHAVPSLEVPEDASSPPVAAPAPVVTETLADLYRDQGYVADARQAYESLAFAEPDPSRRQELVEKAESVAKRPLASGEARLRAFLARMPGSEKASDITGVLEELVRRADGVRAATL